MTWDVWLTKSIGAATAGDYWSRFSQCLRLQLPLPLPQIPSRRLHLEWFRNDRAGFCIRDGSRQDFNTTERIGTDTNAKCRAEYDVTLWGSSGCCLAMPLGTRRGGWTINWPLQSTRHGGIHPLTDVCHARIVQWRWRAGIRTFDCRDYGTSSLSGIPLASQYWNTSLTRQRLRIPWSLAHLLNQTMNKTENISYDWSHVRVSDFIRHSPI
jgi:hypothetical protein